MPKTSNKERSMALYESVLELKSLEEKIAALSRWMSGRARW